MSTLVDHCVSVAHFQLNPSSYLHHKNYPLYLIENDMIVAKLVSPEYNSDDDFSFHF
jgi:hypothetical protein